MICIACSAEQSQQHIVRMVIFLALLLNANYGFCRWRVCGGLVDWEVLRTMTTWNVLLLLALQWEKRNFVHLCRDVGGLGRLGGGEAFWRNGWCISRVGGFKGERQGPIKGQWRFGPRPSLVLELRMLDLGSIGIVVR